jgi:hypothetical protein
MRLISWLPPKKELYGYQIFIKEKCKDERFIVILIDSPNCNKLITKYFHDKDITEPIFVTWFIINTISGLWSVNLWKTAYVAGVREKHNMSCKI